MNSNDLSSFTKARLTCRTGALITVFIISWIWAIQPVFAASEAGKLAVLPPTLPWMTTDLSSTPEQLDTDSEAQLIQIFDVQQERVISTRQNSAAFRKQVESWIQAAHDLSGRARLEAEAGLVIRIPLQPPLPVNRSWLTADIVEVYLFLNPKQHKYPHLLLFTREGKPYVIEIEQNPKAFLKEQGLLRYLTK